MPALSNRKFSSNQGGRIAIDRDGNVFVIIGDRAPTPPTDYGQQNDTTIGKVLHLTPEGKPVKGNPWIGKAGYAPEAYSMGHRSPEGLAINPANGDLWETEHGPQGGDELNKIEPGKNYGWPVITHGIDYNNQPITTGISREGRAGAAALLLESGDRAVWLCVLSGKPVPGLERQRLRGRPGRSVA